ncbi:MAG: hypothetical protein COW03_10545 [Cytophagales bacterium CG12_big_fil_rev_8_21_14_0_65_40_12]|nr:MAG: hypothetical protein COW03_10545 [Cytophagales bacterium CG12_big_fil_rev_8_21_14_0_65_40_12]PIW05558.1 MAG: hypothetical protein COW40_03690 [Cytophagales bacterium CG17_big_fil_post_rev_8_21_14_2_50_40_13]
MTFRLSAIITSLLILLFTSCQKRSAGTHGNIEVLKVNTSNTSTSLYEISKSNRTIKLETRNELIGQVRNLSHSDDFIFISDAIQIFKYDHKGNFITSFGTKGQGPGEYTLLTSIAINANEKKIYGTSFNKLLVYDFDGVFLKEKVYSGIFDAVLALTDKTALLKTEFGAPDASGKGKVNQTILHILNSDLNVTDSMPVRSTQVINGSAAVLGFGIDFISNVNNQSFLYYPVVYREQISRDTLFSINNNQLSPTHKIDFGINDRLKEKFLISSIVRSRNYILVSFIYNSVQHQCLIDLRNKSFVTVKEGFEDTVFNTGKVKLRLWDEELDEFYFIKDAMEVHEVIDGLSQYDNPVISIVSLK